MKVHFDGVDLSSHSGPNTFARRLYLGLLNQGIDIVDVGSDADISLIFIEPSGSPLGRKKVQRLDGVWFKPHEFEHKNHNIKQLYVSADAVVWQSEFDRGMTRHWWGDPQLGSVIRNGIDSSQTFIDSGLADIRQTYEHVFVASSNWHPQKRLRKNIELFDHLQRNGYPKSCLIVMGSNPDYWVSSPHIMYTGPLPENVYRSIFKNADWMLHLAWLDHCPNVVVEALSHDVPVICSNAGGTKELVGDFGIVLVENEYSFELADYDNPPPIDVTQLSKLPTRSSLGNHSDVTIETSVQKYTELFESIL